MKQTQDKPAAASRPQKSKADAPPAKARPGRARYEKPLLKRRDESREGDFWCD